jgi:putative spermidine/putrescine transport system ATP-binding protein
MLWAKTMEVQPVDVLRTAPSANETTTTHVEIEDLRVSYGGHIAVAGASLKVARGEFIGLLGPSGSGKTSVLLMIAGFLTPSGGDVRIDGRSMRGVPPEQRGIGVVFQNYALFQHLRVRQNVSFSLEMRQLPRRQIVAKVERALAGVGLEAFADRYPHELSGGQQQRVALARALVFEPPLLLMDEPLGALDKRLRQQMQLELRDLHRSLGTTILYVTHDQEEALFLADRIAIFNKGRLVQVGSPEWLYREPANQFVAGFLGDCNFFQISALTPGERAWQVRIGKYGGSVPSVRPLTPPASDPRLAVRPHHITFAPTGGTGLAAQVRDMIFLGDCVSYVLDIQGQNLVQARRPHTGDREVLPRGAQVCVRWDWSEARVI